MRACSIVGIALATGAVILSSCSEARAAEVESVPMIVSGALISAGGIGAGVAIAASQGPCGEVDDQCAIEAMLLGPSIAGIFIGLPLMIVGAQPPEPESDDEASDFASALHLRPEVVAMPGGAGLRWRF